MSNAYPDLPNELQCYAEGNLEEGVVLDLNGPENAVKTVRIRLATLADLDNLYSVQGEAWPEELALKRDEIQEVLEHYAGLQLVAIDENLRLVEGVEQPWGSLLILRIDTSSPGVNLIEPHNWEETVRAHRSPTGLAYEELDVSRANAIKSFGLGKSLIILGARAVARDCVLSGKEIMNTTFTSTARSPKYGEWLKREKLENTEENYNSFLLLLALGIERDPVLSTNFRVVRDSHGLVRLGKSLIDSWPIDRESEGAGKRFFRENLARAFMPTEEVLKKLKIDS